MAADTTLGAVRLTVADLGRARRLRHGYRVLRVSPGTLAADQKRRLLPPLIAASTAAFGLDTAEVWQGRLEAGWFDRTDRLLLILAADREVVGWTSYRFARLAGERVLYMDMTGVMPEHQRHGLVPAAQTRVMLRFLAARPWRPVHVVYRTRNPVVMRGLRQRFGGESVAPSLHGETPAWGRTLASAVHEWLAELGELDDRTLAVRGAYAGRGGAIYGEAENPRSGDAEVDRHFDERLGLDDALLVIVRVTLRGVLRIRPGRTRCSRSGTVPAR